MRSRPPDDKASSLPSSATRDKVPIRHWARHVDTISKVREPTRWLLDVPSCLGKAVYVFHWANTIHIHAHCSRVVTWHKAHATASKDILESNSIILATDWLLSDHPHEEYLEKPFNLDFHGHAQINRYPPARLILLTREQLQEISRSAKSSANVSWAAWWQASVLVVPLSLVAQTPPSFVDRSWSSKLAWASYAAPAWLLVPQTVPLSSQPLVCFIWKHQSFGAFHLENSTCRARRVQLLCCWLLDGSYGMKCVLSMPLSILQFVSFTGSR